MGGRGTGAFLPLRPMTWLGKLNLLDAQRAAALRTGTRASGKGPQEPLRPRAREGRQDLIAKAARSGDRLRMRLASRRLIETVVMDPPLVTRKEMLEEPQQEGGGGQRQGFRLSIAVILVGQCDLLPIVAREVALGERGPTRIATAVGGGLLAV